MTTNRNHPAEYEADRVSHEAWEDGSEFVVLSQGYMPDDTDPAWPSKSGQAD